MFEKLKSKKPTTHHLYPGLSPEEQAEAEYNLRQYARLVWRIYERVRREDPELLTDLLKNDTVQTDSTL